MPRWTKSLDFAVLLSLRTGEVVRWPCLFEVRPCLAPLTVMPTTSVLLSTRRLFSPRRRSCRRASASRESLGAALMRARDLRVRSHRPRGSSGRVVSRRNRRPSLARGVCPGVTRVGVSRRRSRNHWHVGVSVNRGGEVCPCRGACALVILVFLVWFVFVV